MFIWLKLSLLEVSWLARIHRCRSSQQPNSLRKLDSTRLRFTWTPASRLSSWWTSQSQMGPTSCSLNHTRSTFTVSLLNTPQGCTARLNTPKHWPYLASPFRVKTWKLRLLWMLWYQTSRTQCLFCLMSSLNSMELSMMLWLTKLHLSTHSISNRRNHSSNKRIKLFRTRYSITIIVRQTPTVSIWHQISLNRMQAWKLNRLQK